MSEIAYFDPADMMVWFDQNVYLNRFEQHHSESKAAYIREETREAAFGTIRGAFDTAAGINEDVLRILNRWGPPAVMSLLTLWHEQRHFLDHLLTNFGASQARIQWQLRAQLNVIYAAGAADGVLGVPLDVYADPIECESLKLGPVAAGLLGALGDFLFDRREMLAQDKKDGKTPVCELPVDGHCQLEALGSLAQIAGFTHLLQKHAAPHLELLESSFTQFPYLVTVLKVMRACGLNLVHEFSKRGGQSFIRIDPNLLSPILLASLMCRRSARSGDDITTSYLPARRLERILTEIAKDGITEVPSADDGYEVVEKACRKIWSRSIVDDLDEDISFEETQVSKFKQTMSSEDVGFMAQCNAARKELRRMLVTHPGLFCDSLEYATKVIPSVRPKIVLADRSGQFLMLGKGEPDQFRSLFAMDSGTSDHQIRICYYYDLRNADQGVVGSLRFDDRHWLEGFAKSRHVRMLAAGRKQVAGSDLDAFLVERELKEMGIELRFRPEYEYPTLQRSSSKIFELMNTERLLCEISGREVTADTSISLSPWAFRRYEALRGVLQQHGKLGICPTDGSFKDNYIGNWTWWLVHRDYQGFLTED